MVRRAWKLRERAGGEAHVALDGAVTGWGRTRHERVMVGGERERLLARGMATGAGWTGSGGRLSEPGAPARRPCMSHPAAVRSAALRTLAALLPAGVAALALDAAEHLPELDGDVEGRERVGARLRGRAEAAGLGWVGDAAERLDG